MPLYKNKSSSTMLRKKMKSWNGFPYEKQNLTVTEASQQERLRKQKDMKDS